MSTDLATNDIPKNPAVRRAWVSFQLRIRGSSFVRIARRAGVSRQAVCQALMLPSVHLEKAIAKELGLRVQDLFPERFNEAGERIPLTRGGQRSSRDRWHNVQLRERA